MPIMDGFEACKRIYAYMSGIEKNVSSDSSLIELMQKTQEKKNERAPLIYALTGDLSIET